MKKILFLAVLFILMVQLVNAAEVCVVVDYGSESEDKPDSKCVTIEEGDNGYVLLNKLGWSMGWKDYGGLLGHALCNIKDVGYDPDTCWGDRGYWNFNLIQNGEWYHVIDRGFDGTPHYETKNGDFVGLAFGQDGAKPEMFKANISKAYVDSEKETKLTETGGKLKDVHPGSNIKLKIELENFYGSDTDIEVKDISIKTTIEEIENGEDIDKDIPDFDMKTKAKETKDIEFDIPWEIEEKDRLLTIELTAKDDAGIKYDKKFIYDLQISKETSKLKITKAQLNKDSYSCGENALLDFSILNVGSNDQKVSLYIVNDNLGININENFDLKHEPYGTSNKYGKIFNIRLPDKLEKKSYPLEITAEYGSNKEVGNVTIVSVCGESEGSSGVKESGAEQSVVAGQGEASSEQEQAISQEETKGIADAAKETVTSNMPLALMVVLSILIMIIIGLGVMFWVIRK